MKLGALFFATDRSARPDELGRDLEERGYESVWFSEHTHMPVSRKSKWPGGDGDPPPEYQRLISPIVSLTAAAMSTSNLRLATGVCLAAQHDPILLAKEVASIDYLSNGRVILGVGMGWNREEMMNHGVDPDNKREILREHVLAAQGIWSQEQASFLGTHVQFSKSWSWPKPIQDPLPVVMGANAGQKTFDHILDYCQGWAPVHGRRDLTKDFRAFEAYRENVNERSIELTVISCPPERGWLDAYGKLGVDRCVMHLPSLPMADLQVCLDEVQPLVNSLL